jgi:hypothetical protein
MDKLITELAFLVHVWSQKSQVDVFFYQNRSTWGHTKVLGNQELTHDIVIFFKKPKYFFLAHVTLLTCILFTRVTFMHSYMLVPHVSGDKKLKIKLAFMGLNFKIDGLSIQAHSHHSSNINLLELGIAFHYTNNQAEFCTCILISFQLIG